MFVREKTINGNKYGYLVENEWALGSSRQKVVQYLGKIIDFGTVITSIDVSQKKYEHAITELLKETLKHAGFTEHHETMHKEDFIVNTTTGEVRKNGKNAAAKINEGYLCSETINTLKNFKSTERHEETAIKLAEAIIAAGLSIPEETFVQLFEKVKPEETVKNGEFYY